MLVALSISNQGVLGDLRNQDGSTICVRRTMCQCGAVGCWRRESAGQVTLHWHHCPTSSCLAIFLRAIVISSRTLSNRHSRLQQMERWRSEEHTSELQSP